MTWQRLGSFPIGVIAAAALSAGCSDNAADPADIPEATSATSTTEATTTTIAGATTTTTSAGEAPESTTLEPDPLFKELSLIAGTLR